MADTQKASCFGGKTNFYYGNVVKMSSAPHNMCGECPVANDCEREVRRRADVIDRAEAEARSGGMVRVPPEKRLFDDSRAAAAAAAYDYEQEKSEKKRQELLTAHKKKQQPAASDLTAYADPALTEYTAVGVGHMKLSGMKMTVVSESTKQECATETQPKKESNPMSTNLDTKTNRKGTIQMLTDAGKHGAAVALADEAGESILEITQQIGADILPPGMLDTPAGRQIAKLVTATAIYHAAGAGIIPDSEGISTACALVIEAASRDFLQPHIKKLKPQFSKLAQAGKSAGK